MVEENVILWLIGDFCKDKDLWWFINNNFFVKKKCQIEFMFSLGLCDEIFFFVTNPTYCRPSSLLYLTKDWNGVNELIWIDKYTENVCLVVLTGFWENGT